MGTYWYDLIKNYHRNKAITLSILNLISLVLGVLYLFGQRPSVFWNIYGLLMIGTFLGNLWLASDKERKDVPELLYLMLSAVFMILIAIINTVVSTNPTNDTSQSIFSILMIFTLFLLGEAIAIRRVLRINKRSIAVVDTRETFWLTGLKKLSIILLSAILYGGLFFAINLLRKHKNGILEVFLPEYALFYAISSLSIGILILKLINRVKYYLYYSIVLATTTFMFLVFLLPFVSVPSLLRNAKNSYMEAFGKEDGLHTETMNELQSDNFRQVPFSIPEYFFGTSSKEYQVMENILFYKGTTDKDQGLELYFDVYTPPVDGKDLPGKNSVLIRVHGGAWTMGDKGAYNYAQMNKYFASRGYVVFDIQYGLNGLVDWLGLVKGEETRLGDFTIDDMIRHIGIFTKYLAEHADEYNGNLSSVFISGGSAGGQLSLASGLGLVSGRYNQLFDSRLKIKGLIPFYPANGLSGELGIRGRKEFVDPSYLVAEDSPPCLMFQGSHDGLVDIKIAQTFRAAYQEKGNKRCALITMPFGGHASDFYFSGYYNQIFLYYMERFIYQYQ